jgi:hypothetical protein
LSARLWENIFEKCCKSKVASWKMDGRESMRMEKEGNEIAASNPQFSSCFDRSFWMILKLINNVKQLA